MKKLTTRPWLLLLVILDIFMMVSCATMNQGKEYAEILWNVKVKSPIFSSIAMDDNDNMYFGTFDKGLMSLNKTGEARWTFLPVDKIEFGSSPLLTEDGKVIVGANNGKVYAVNQSDGALQWEFLTAKSIFASPALGHNGVIYIASLDYKLYALDADGAMLWYVNTDEAIYASPIIGQDGTIYIGSVDKGFYAINPDGTIKWKYNLESAVYSGAALSQDNSTVYFGTENGSVYALDTTTAQLKWKTKVSDTVYASIVLAENGDIYVCAHNNIISSYDVRGNRLWSHRVPGEIIATPAVGDDGSLYIASTRNDNDEGFLSIMTDEGDLIWERSFSRDLRSSPVIGKTGTVFFGSQVGRIYAMKGRSSAPASHDWSMFRGNRSHRGRTTNKVEPTESKLEDSQSDLPEETN